MTTYLLGKDIMTRGLARIVTAGAIALAMVFVPVSAAMAAPAHQHHSPSGEANQGEVITAALCAGSLIGVSQGVTFTISVSNYTVEHGDQLWHMVKVLSSNQELSSGDWNDLSKAGIDWAWMGIGLLAENFPGVPCLKLGVEVAADRIQAIDDAAAKKWAQSHHDVVIPSDELNAIINSKKPVPTTTPVSPGDELNAIINSKEPATGGNAGGGTPPTPGPNGTPCNARNANGQLVQGEWLEGVCFYGQAS